MRIGTDYFVSMTALERYYGKDGATKALEEGRAFVGKPILKEGETLVVSPGEGRYYIEDGKP